MEVEEVEGFLLLGGGVAFWHGWSLLLVLAVKL